LQGPVLIGDDCEICRGVQIIGPAVIGHGNYIQEETVIRESITWQNVRCGTGAVISGSLIANDCYIGAGCQVERSVIGDHITITARTRLGEGSRIWPAQ